MQKRWVQTSQCDQQQTQQLSETINVAPAIAEILCSRGIATFDAARGYFRPQLSELHDPFLMRDMDVAINRISKALKNNERILIYGDYDVDGTTAVTVVYSFFRKFTEQIEFYIPDRHKEGYGISSIGIDHAKSTGASLIIALDCGIKSVDKIAYARELAIDFIVCDHHTPGEELPDAVAVLDPKRADCPYPFKELSGCGIGLKLVQAYAQKNQLPDSAFTEYLDLAMVSIAADIVSLVDENRIIAWHGLKKLNDNPCAGLKALMNISGRKEHYNITDVVFQLAPRINAAGRMEHGQLAVKMLLCEEDGDALQQSLQINLQNTDRKTFDQQITLEALAQIASDARSANRKTTVVYKEDWNKGVIGIVASRLTEKYYRPTIVLTKSNGMLTGSARSVVGFDLYEALLACSDHLEQFGGHKFAAGLTLHEGALQGFMDKFEEIVSATIRPEQLCPEILIDTTIQLADIDAKFHRILAQMAPFGPDNMTPVFMTREVLLAGVPMILGTEHLKFHIFQDGSPVFECIGFGLANFAEILKPNEPFSVCYTIEENNWKEKRSLQLNIKGIKTILDEHEAVMTSSRSTHGAE